MTAAVRAEIILGLQTHPVRWNKACKITPEQARQILEHQPPQRPVSQSSVNAIVAEIAAGRFVLTNEAIAFDENGLLFDGQHRMWACFESGFSIEVLCCFNEPRANFDKIGTVVRKRNAADVLVIEGTVADAATGNLLGSASRFLYAYDQNISPVSVVGPAQGWSNDTLRQTIARHVPLLTVANDYRSMRLLFPRGPTVALVTLMREADAAKAAVFEHQITTGEGLKLGDPALTLRGSATATSFHRRGPRVEMTYRIARAWNAFYEGRSVRTLYGSNAAGLSGSRLRKDGMDLFPRIAGLKPVQKAKAVKAKITAQRSFETSTQQAAA